MFKLFFLNAKAIAIKNPEQINAMKQAGRACSELLDHLAPHIIPGANTESIDQRAVAFIAERGWIAEH